jgi:hypothetical protein
MSGSKRSWKKILLWVIGIGAIVLVAIQFVPYGRVSHTNPPTVNAFKWPDPQAEAITKRSCYDCHSNETDWWWATDIAPFSWLVQSDVDGGRGRLNFSEYDGQPPAAELQQAVQGGMPPIQFTVIHWDARLSDAEKQTLVKAYADGIAVSGGSSSGGFGGPSGRQDSASPVPSPSTSASAAAVATINQVCSRCHPADPALSFHAGDAAEAKALIDSMVQRGAQVTAAQEQLLIDYFTR